MVTSKTQHSAVFHEKSGSSDRISRIQWLMLLFALSLMSWSCQSPQKKPAGQTRMVKDMLGREVAVPEKTESVVGIGPGALRLLVYLQAQDMVVGVEELEKRSGRPYIFAQPQLTDKPTIGPAFTGDAELIAARNPEVIFKTYTTRAEADELQRKTGIPVIALQYVNPTPEWHVLDSALALMGHVLGRSARAKALNEYYQSLIDTLNRTTANITGKEKPAVYLGGLSHRGTHGINSTSPYYEPFAFTNVHNVAATLRKKYNKNEGIMIDIEQLMVWNPEIIFIDLAGKALVDKDLDEHTSFFSQIEAFRNGEIYGVHPYNWYTTNYATVLANAWYVASVLYPAEFETVNPAQKANQIYRNFLGRGVYKAMAEEYGPYTRLSYEDLTGKAGQ
jgi:iron complex transport system substrate-binding protein